MRLEFIGKTKCRITKVSAYNHKLGQKELRHSVKLRVRATCPNSILDKFSPRIRGLLFAKAAGSEKMQKQLEGIEVVSDTPSLTEEGAKLGTLHWNDEQTGCTFVIDRAIDPILLKDCTVKDVDIISRDGGTVWVDFTLIPAEVDRTTGGDLMQMKDVDTFFEMTAPQVDDGQADVEDENDTAGSEAAEVISKAAGKGRRGGATLTPIAALKKAARGDGQQPGA
jgi:hypothetical protein